MAPPWQLSVLLLVALPLAQATDEASLPTVPISGPTVVAFWLAPTSNDALAADPDLASALDEHQYFWAETRERLLALGVSALGQPGRRFRVADAEDIHLFEAPTDGAPVGYLLVEPGGTMRPIYRMRYPDHLLDIVREHFGLDGPT